MTLCSDASATLGEQLAGSAPEAVAWVALEQSGPWGARALTESHLDPGVGRALESAAGSHRTRVVLVRRPGRHADTNAETGTDPRRVLIAFTVPSRAWLLAGSVSSPFALLDLDWRGLEGGDVAAVRRSLPGLDLVAHPHLLVCTNGARDLCCAVKGRPIALGLAARHPDLVWEVTHTSGHRFAPTAVLLPAGTLHGRLDLDAAEALLVEAAAGRTVLAGSRGRSTWSASAQVAELAVRKSTGELGLDALSVLSHEALDTHRWRSVVGHPDERAWEVDVVSVPSDEERAESCGKQVMPLRRWVTTIHPSAR
jgi:hypothetical protein